MTLATRGTKGKQGPSEVGSVVQPADFELAGMHGRFARGIDEIIEVFTSGEISVKLGPYQAGKLGRYSAESFFTGVKGQRGRLLVKPFVASNAVQASDTLQSTGSSPADTLTISAAFRAIVDKSADGNLSGYTLTAADRVTLTAASSEISGATEVTLSAVGQVRVGDILAFDSSPTHFAKVSAIDESLKLITMSATTDAITSGETVRAIGFRIVSFRKNATGANIKVSTPENDVVLSLEPENSEFYVNNAFANHPYLVLLDEASGEALEESIPADVTTKTFLTSGSDGTAPTPSDWDYSAFDSKKIVLLHNPDDDSTTANNDGEAYCTGHNHEPIWIYNIPDQTSLQGFIDVGAQYQRSDRVLGVAIAGTLPATDKIGVGANATIDLPVGGVIMGTWFFSFRTRGFHKVPAGSKVPLPGFVQVKDRIEDTFTDEQRTRILEVGLNIIQINKGYIIQEFRTPSTDLGELFGNQLFMKNFIIQSIITSDSILAIKSEPNRISRIREAANNIRDFGKKLFDGSFPFQIDPQGAFLDFVKEDGTDSTFQDVFIVEDVALTTPQASLVVGEAFVSLKFVAPPPNELFEVTVATRVPLF